MSKYTDLALERRKQFSPDGRPVYNCCQAVVSVFAEDAGYDEAACLQAATYFRGGMQMGSVCGAITGALMALGLSGVDDGQAPNVLYEKLRQKHDGLMNCSDLLRVNKEKGGDRKVHCDDMVYELLAVTEEILRERGIIA